MSVTRDGVDVPVGVVTLAWPAGHEARPLDRGSATAIADLLAVAVDRVRLASLVAERAEWLERMANTDPLTGLANARAFGRVLELEVARAARQSSELSVAAFDVDRFADLNAEAGRSTGDDVLRTVASVLAESVRLVDTVARLGGDEFAVVAPGAGGPSVAQRVLEGVRSLPPIEGTKVTISAGVARFPRDGASADELLAAATDALHRAKATGSDRLETSPSDGAG
jgi:diguanylate cyclase (GGDEF)-like protein